MLTEILVTLTKDCLYIRILLTIQVKLILHKCGRIIYFPCFILNILLWRTRLLFIKSVTKAKFINTGKTNQITGLCKTNFHLQLEIFHQF